jgi:stringent starvation protein B
VVAIYARENGQGMAFPAPTRSGAPDADPVTTEEPRGLRLAPVAPSASPQADSVAGAEVPPEPDPEPPGGGRPSLKRVK